MTLQEEGVRENIIRKTVFWIINPTATFLKNATEAATSRLGNERN